MTPTDKTEPAAFAPTTFKTSLKLTQEQEGKLIRRALKRIEEVSAQMGLGMGGMLDGWMGKRRLYQMQYDNEWEWRRALGGVFQHSNFSLNICKRFTRLAAAKSVDELIGTDPFFAALPRQPRSAQLAKQAEKFVQDKIEASFLKNVLVHGLLQATIIGESVVKLTHIMDSTRYRGPAVVLVNQSGQPILTNRGDLIYKKDNFLLSTLVERQLVLEKEPSTVARDLGNGALEINRFPALDQPQIGVFQRLDDLEQTLMRKEGLDAQVLDYRDFLCPLDAETVQQADINVHFYDEDVETLQEIYRGVEIAKEWLSETGEPKSLGAAQPREVHGEQPNVGSEVRRRAHMAEVYIRCDADEDGMQEEIMLVLDVKREKPVFYDYMANHMAERPFYVIPGVEQVPKRWYGVGMFEMFDHRQQFVDLQYNRANFRSSNAGTVTFWNPQATREGRAGLPLLIGQDIPYTLHDGYRGEDAVQRVQLSENDPVGKELMDLTIQSLQAESGGISMADGDFSGLPQVETATGSEIIERTGNIQQKFTLTPQGMAINKILGGSLTIILENMNDREMYFYQQGEVTELVELNREEIRRLSIELKLVLTRTRSSKLLESSKLAKEIAVEFYSLPPQVAARVRPLYVQMLKALEITDADALLIDPMEDPLAAEMMAQSLTPQAPPDQTQQGGLRPLMNATAPLRRTNAGQPPNPANGQLPRTPVGATSARGSV